eukprot:scaffold3946_cov177-Amphora_coffeaeformis.AAC.12
MDQHRDHYSTRLSSSPVLLEMYSTMKFVWFSLWLFLLSTCTLADERRHQALAIHQDEVNNQSTLYTLHRQLKMSKKSMKKKSRKKKSMKKSTNKKSVKKKSEKKTFAKVVGVEARVKKKNAKKNKKKAKWNYKKAQTTKTETVQDAKELSLGSTIIQTESTSVPEDRTRAPIPTRSSSTTRRPTSPTSNTAARTVSPTPAPIVPTKSPTTKAPTLSPSRSPALSPTPDPTETPTESEPQSVASLSMTDSPTERPVTRSSILSPTTPSPTLSPTPSPSDEKESSPTDFAESQVDQEEKTSKSPSKSPTRSPIANSKSPTNNPTRSPIASPTPLPTVKKPPDDSTQRSPTTDRPTPLPTRKPTKSPSKSPSRSPVASSKSPTQSPTRSPVASPTPLSTVKNLTDDSTQSSPTTDRPTPLPTRKPTKSPSVAPTERPTAMPSDARPETYDDGYYYGDDYYGDDYYDDEYYDDEYFDDDGLSPGDVYVMEENQLTTPGYEDGYSSGRCVVLSDTTNENNLYCSVSFTFDEGSIFIAGLLYELVVVGGTGCFEGIVGEVSLQTPGTGDLAYQVDAIYNAPSNACSALEDTTWVRLVNEVSIDWGRDGSLSPGDSYVFDSNPVTVPGGELAGSVAGECMYLQGTLYTELYCTMTFAFAWGKLVVEGVLGNMVIVGGTGCFFEASGSVSGSIATGPVQSFSITYDAVDSASKSSCSWNVFDNPWTEPYGESYVDYQPNGAEDSAEIYAYGNKDITIPLSGSATVQGILNGRCIILGSSYYCSYTVQLPDGMVHFRGFWEDMTILSGTGCYRGFSGGVSASDPSGTGFVYTFTLPE